MGLIKDVRAGRVACDTLVVDSITSIWNVIQRSFPDDRYFKIIKPKFRDFVDFLYEKLDKHVVMTAWEKELYAAPGTVVNGKTVDAKDMVSIGKTLDADKKAMFGFDFVVRIFEERGKRYGEVLKSRSHKLPKGTRIATSFDDVPAWKIFEPLLSSVDFEERQTEAEAVGTGRRKRRGQARGRLRAGEAT